MKRTTREDRVFSAVNFVILAAFMLITLYPLWYVLCASFSNIFEVVKHPLLLFPVGFTLDSYKRVLENAALWRGFLNSFAYMGVGTMLNIFMTMITAFALSRDSLPGRKWLTKLFILTMYVSGGMIPTYLVVDGLHLRDTFFAMIIPNAVNVYFVIIAVSFLRSTIPESIIEAARIDGAGYIRILFTIVIPLSGPLIGLLALQYGLGHWNSFTQAMIYLDNEARYPLQLVLRDILIKADSNVVSSMMMNQNIDYEKQTIMREGIKYVSMVVSSVPLLIAYPFMKKYFAKGMMIGGVKG